MTATVFHQSYMTQRPSLFTPAAPKRFGCWAKFAILSASAGRTNLCIEKKQKLQNKSKKTTTRSLSLTFVYCYLFYLLRHMFAMWLMKLVLLLHNSCSIWFHAWCCNMESVVHMCIRISVSTLGFTIYLSNELFAKINRPTSTHPNQINFEDVLKYS